MKRTMKLHKYDIAFALALALKLFGAGFSYFCVLDDFIQYGSYPMFGLSHVLFTIGTLSSRPLASLLDPTLWGSFYPHMAFALCLMGILYFLSALFLDRILTTQGIKITPLLYTVYLLLPLSFEGTYWISASSRIVVGLFFATLASLLLISYLQSGKKKVLPLYILFTWASFGFYESVLIFSVLLQGAILLKDAINKKTCRRIFLILIPAVGAAGLLIYYKLAAGLGALGSRAAGFSFDHPLERIKELFSQFTYIFTAGLFRTTVIGFADGIKHIVSNPASAVPLSVLLILVSFACAFTSRKYKITAKASVCIPAGLLLMLLPLLPNLLVSDIWLTYRTVFICLPGACLFLAPFAARLLKNRRVRTILVFLTVLVFSVGCINELYTYKAVSTLDTQIAKSVADSLDEEVLAGEKNVVLVLPYEISVPQTSYYKDHVKSVTGADWSLTGAVRAIARNNQIRLITPVYSLDGIDTKGTLVLYMNTSYQITEASYE